MPLKSSWTNSWKKQTNASKQQRKRKPDREKIATAAKRSENQTFSGNWIVCTLPPFFRNILTLKSLKQSIRSKMLFLLFNYGFLLGWFSSSSSFSQALVPANFNYAKQPTTYKEKENEFPKKTTFKKTRRFFGYRTGVPARQKSTAWSTIFIAITSLSLPFVVAVFHFFPR